MKRKALLLLMLIGAACEYNDLRTTPPVLVGKWQLIQTLLDPGDGSGVYMPVSSTKTISFFSDSTFQATGSMCQVSPEGGQATKGTYSPSQRTIMPSGCSPTSFKTFYLIKGDYLIVSYPCIEGCSEKYAMVVN